MPRASRESKGESELLANYTFDLSLGAENEFDANLVNSDLFLSGHGIFDRNVANCNRSQDQVDHLLEELKELVGLRQDTVSSNMISESNNSGAVSPCVPRCVSMNANDAEFDRQFVDTVDSQATTHDNYFACRLERFA